MMAILDYWSEQKNINLAVNYLMNILTQFGLNWLRRFGEEQNVESLQTTLNTMIDAKWGQWQMPSDVNTSHSHLDQVN